jgi:hypothetical protein
VSAFDRCELFPTRALTRVAVFGNSRMFSGFIPEVFDREVGPGVASYNLALAENSYFLDELEGVGERKIPQVRWSLSRALIYNVVFFGVFEQLDFNYFAF